jgi:hypothetical protein
MHPHFIDLNPFYYIFDPTFIDFLALWLLKYLLGIGRMWLNVRHKKKPVHRLNHLYFINRLINLQLLFLFVFDPVYCQ